MTPLSAHFTLEELTWSDTGARLGIDNTPSEIITGNLMLLAAALEDVRTLLGQPIHINSGYRCDQLNTAIGGARNSRHMLGLAADFICPAFGAPLEVARMLEANLGGFDQLIYEHTWVHLGLAITGEDPRHQVLTLMPGRTYALGLIERAAA
jgi:zinc D-Ala-D-Ala carboxypeptidase